MDTQLNRWVVLKGLLNAKDEAAATAAVAERQFLAAVKHGKIVGIYTFAARDGESFIVMEYVGGRTLKAIRRERGPLPPAEAMAYVLGILPAFSYLHGQGLVYCDFKPDNVMLEGGDVKLIDMGAVRRIDDPHGDIYGTAGYKAPEADQNPQAVSDLYTVGRTLLVLLLEFDNTGRYATELPPPTGPLAAHESLYRFLQKATAPSSGARFQSAEEMAAQLTGVLRETVGRDGRVPAADSAVFLPECPAAGDPTALRDAWRRLPELRLDPADPAAAELFATRSAESHAQAALFAAAMAAKPRSSEARLRAADALIGTGEADPEAVLRLLDGALTLDPSDWRPDWHCGRLYLSLGRPAEAVECLDRVYSENSGGAGAEAGAGHGARSRRPHRRSRRIVRHRGPYRPGVGRRRLRPGPLPRRRRGSRRGGGGARPGARRRCPGRGGQACRGPHAGRRGGAGAAPGRRPAGRAPATTCCGTRPKPPWR